MKSRLRIEQMKHAGYRLVDRTCTAGGFSRDQFHVIADSMATLPEARALLDEIHVRPPCVAKRINPRLAYMMIIYGGPK